MRRLILFATLVVALPAVAADPPPPPPPPPPPLVDDATVDRLREREAQLLERLHALDPDRYAEVVALKRTNPRAYVGALMRLAHFFDRGVAGPPSPELQAEIAALQAIRARYPDGMTTLSAGDTRKVRTEVAAIADRVFDLRQAERRQRIDELRASLTELEEDVARRDRDRKALIDAFVDQFLLGPVDL
ncbi:MAG: hypothetical protein H6733_14615 [Alphaproteobacteria bacterium]|nr:hypothetical protein [Alphaproteobacteria bacterium]